MTRVKICGITEEDDMLAAIEAGADAVGFVTGFSYSPRNLDFNKAMELSLKAFPLITCVLVTNEEMLRKNIGMLKYSKISAVQLYGEDSTLIKKLKSMGIDVIHPIRRDVELNSKECYDAFLVDSYDAKKDGGTGRQVDHSFAIRVKQIVYPKPLILSGGLTVDNVSRAVAAVKPYAVDVSSGVERYPGRKDAQKMARFVERAKGVV
ncbi:MAG: phosphoribosylanthranilate isomerase [Conexivisphaerales archaeon]